MRDYFDVPDTILLDRDISAFDILEIAINHMAYVGYMNKLEEKERKKNQKH